MSDKVTLTLKDREIVGKKVKQLRKTGMVPATVYGNKFEAKSVMAESVVLEKVWKSAGKHHPVEITLSSGKKLAMIKSADLDPVKRKLRHLSFQIVKQNEKVETEVSIHIENEGQTPAERAGLVVLQALENVEISAFPGNLPDFLEVPSEKLVEPGDHVTVADIKKVEGVEILDDGEIVVASVYEPAALAAANDAAAGDAEVGDEAKVEAEEGEAPAEGEGEESKPEADSAKE